MDLAKAAQYIQQPALLKYADKAELEQWVETYPFVPVFRVLLACKVMENSSDPSAASVLEKAAFYVNNRRSLKKLVHEWPLSIVEEEIPPHETPETAPDEALVYSENTLEQTSEVAIAIDISGEEPLKVPEVIVEETVETTSVSPESVDIAAVEDATHLESEVLSDVDEMPLEEITSEIELPSSETEIESETLVAEKTENVDTTLLNARPENEIQLEVEQNIEVAAEATNAIESEEVANIEPLESDNNSIEETQDAADDEMSDEDFLKTIGKWSPETIVTSAEGETEGETPGDGVFELGEDAMLDAGIAHTDITWLLPWMEDFTLPEIAQVEKKIQIIEPEKSTPPSEVVQPINTTEPVSEEIKAPTANISSEKIEDAPQVPVQDMRSTAEKATLNTTHSFEDWLNIVEQKPIDPQQPVFEAPARDIVEELKQHTPQQEVKKPVIPPMPDQPVTLQEKEVQRIASESVAFQWGNATETLAKIFIRQGKPDKAIEIYQQLILKYPEKSTYFASLIKNIKGN